MPIDRRRLLALSAGGLATPALGARVGGDRYPTWPPHERFLLWPGIPVGASSPLPRLAPELTGKPGEYHDIWMRGTTYPDVGVFRPTRPNGTAVLIAPGGGYGFVSLRGEGMDAAKAMNAAGITAFVLNYRLPGEGWEDRANVPLADCQRAMRLIRSRAGLFRIDPERLGVLGFSAGGHLAGSLATLWDQRIYRPVDAADRLSARPAFAGLMYAVTSMDAGRSRGGSRANLLGPSPDLAMQHRYAVDRHITAATPPLFVCHAEDDATVPIVNSIDLLEAARAAKAPAEAHFFARGGHGFGARLPKAMPGSLWPDLFVRWIGETLASRTTA